MAYLTHARSVGMLPGAKHVEDRMGLTVNSCCVLVHSVEMGVMSPATLAWKGRFQKETGIASNVR